ncbi:MAG: hypothetical protein M3011_03465 [Actinomycetota bacterium]|nr:hypothetical protein [Actinomycetota bacterium]
MAGTQIRPTGSGHVEVALAVGLSAVFIVLAVLVTPLVATVAVVPASIAVGRWRAHALPTRSPHSLSVPVYSPTAVVNAPRVSTSTGETSVNPAA